VEALIHAGIEAWGEGGAFCTFYSSMGRPSIDPALLIRILVAGYSLGLGEVPLWD
jgi:hypothetical protein